MEEKINILNELEEASASTLPHLIDIKTCFYLPADYFNTLPLNISTGIFIKSLPAFNPYYIPADYFQNLPDTIVEKVRLSNNIPVLANAQNIYTVPENYFDGFAGSILKKIKEGEAEDAQQELETISPFLSSIPKTNIYSIPADYFTSINAGEIAKQSVQQPKVKVVSLKSGRSRFSKWITYAAAACVAVLLSGSGFMYFLRDKNAGDAASTAQIVIADTDVQKQISQLSDDEIANYLNTNGNMSVYTNSGAETQQQNLDFQNMLKTVSDEEIQQYLKIAEPESARKTEEDI